MAERRMFSKTIIDSDDFLEMPITSQLLYFHLAMRADDDGFVNKPKAIMKTCCCKEDDIKLLFAKRFLIPFDSGVVVIKHWKIHNYIQRDRYKPTVYQQEKSCLTEDKSKAYVECIQNVSTLDTQDRIGKDSLGKDSLEEEEDKSSPPPPPPVIITSSKEVFKTYETLIGTLNSRVSEIFDSYDLSDELKIKAIQEAHDNNKKSLKYIEAILKSYESENIKVIADLDKRRKKPTTTKPCNNGTYDFDDIERLEFERRMKKNGPS